MRQIDDKIIYTLNTSIPTESFKGQVNPEATCKELYSQIQIVHRQREEAIKKCIMVSAEGVKHIKELRDANRDDISIDKSFKAEQRKVHFVVVFILKKNNNNLNLYSFVFCNQN